MPDEEDTLLSDLCTICHINPPKYRCPRCQTRTCSLPCTRRHKHWSQCSGVRDPGEYLRRSELATESAFDRDYNFITGVERGVERAERDTESRGVRVEGGGERGDGDDGGRKRKRGRESMGDGGPRGLVKGEAAFLRRAAEAGVTVVQAPRGMSREKGNSSKWFPKQKCLNWSVEWVLPDKGKVTRNCLESTPLADVYDRVVPLPKEESMGYVQLQVNGPVLGQERTQFGAEKVQEDTAIQDSAENPLHHDISQSVSRSTEINPHRDVYFYLHRPRTPTKRPVLIPLDPNVSLTTALRGRTVLEFPTIYVLPDSPGTVLTEKGHLFLLEEEYLKTEKPAEEAGDALNTDVADGAGDSLDNSVDLGQVDEQKVLDVLKQDLFGTGSAS